MLKKLGMPYAQFDIEILESEQFHVNGNTSVLLKFSANKLHISWSLINSGLYSVLITSSSSNISSLGISHSIRNFLDQSASKYPSFISCPFPPLTKIFFIIPFYPTSLILMKRP